jgi:hypothetical protein
MNYEGLKLFLEGLSTQELSMFAVIKLQSSNVSNRSKANQLQIPAVDRFKTTW